MNLHEEYILRNKLNVPIVQYDSSSCVLLKSKSSPYTWLVLRIAWRDVANHPGYYIITTDHVNNACYNSCAYRLFHRLIEKSVYCEEYERVVLDFVDSIKETYSAVPGSEHYFSLWRMFFYAFDSVLIQEPKMIRPWMCTVLSDQTSFKEKQAACDFLRAHFELKLSSESAGFSVYNDLFFNILTLSFDKSDWLVRLING
jgi:hypothetical protein